MAFAKPNKNKYQPKTSQMKTKLAALCLMSGAMVLSSCEQNKFSDNNEDWKSIEVLQLSPEMQKVRDYVPEHSVIAHRGSTFWVPEETEAAFRWGRNIGADYLEADLQITQDGVILALHDVDLRRTTNIENVYPERELLPASSFTYDELMKLDAGSWFNDARPEQARKGFAEQKQYISTLEDLIMFAQGKRIKRDANGNRIYTRTNVQKDAKGREISAQYSFEYENDPADNGNRPGIYIETKEPWLNPGIEKALYNELDRLGWNIITKPSADNRHFVDGKVNVANTNGKVILQTFSQESLQNLFNIFKGQVPTCYLLWLGNGATDMPKDDARTYSKFINFGIQLGAHFTGPSIAGAPNNYPELLTPWQAALTKRSGLKIHPYSFDTRDQMAKYYGEFNYGNDLGALNGPYMDGMFTNRADVTLDYYFEKKVRPSGKVASATQILDQLGY